MNGGYAIATWLTQRTQYVVLDGLTPNYIKVESGVLQGQY